VALADIAADEAATLKRLLIRIYDNIESPGSRRVLLFDDGQPRPLRVVVVGRRGVFGLAAFV